MRKVIINCDCCKSEIDGDPFTIVKQDTHQLNRFYDPFEIDLCGKCAKKMFDRARAGLIEPSEAAEDILDSLPEIEEEPEEIQDTAEFEAKLDRLEEIVKDAPKKGGRKASYDTGKLTALARAGWSPKAIGEELKIPAATVSKYLYNHKGELKK